MWANRQGETPVKASKEHPSEHTTDFPLCANDQLFSRMGASYSQPPRGFLYSTPDNLLSPNEYTPEFTSFADLYRRDLDATSSLPYLVDGQTLYSFKQCLSMATSIISHLFTRGLTPDSIFAVYAPPSFAVALIMDAALLHGVKCLVVSPNTCVLGEFARRCSDERVKAIFCSLEHSKQARSLLTQNVHVIPLDGKFKDITANAPYLPIPNVPADQICLISGKFPITSQNTVRFLREWSTRLKISRDAIIVSNLSIDDPLFNVIRLTAIFTRARISFVSSVTEISEYHPTHVFLSKEAIVSLHDDLDGRVREHSFFWRAGHAMKSSWNKWRLLWGSEVAGLDLSTLRNAKIDFGVDLHFIFVSGVLSARIHERLTIAYAKPIVTVFVPPEWGNLGFALPCDLRFTKYETVGGPIVNLVRVNEESGRLVAAIGGEDIELEIEGGWDEEGAMKLQD
jgi:hypothetical protein